MSIETIIAISSSALLFLLFLRGTRNKAILLLFSVVVIASWLIVGVNWLTHRVEQSIHFVLPDLKFLAFAVLVSGAVLLGGRILGKKGFQTSALLLASLWLAGGMGWLAGEWSGVLSITMPSLLILVVGLLALPPFVLPVPPLPWKWPTLIAMLYSFAWLTGVWNAWIEMDIIAFWVYLQGMLLILRFALPMGSVSEYVPVSLFMVYGFFVVMIWRGFRGFELSSFNLLVLSQGLLTLSAYALPVRGEITHWRLGLPVKSSTLSWSVGLTGLYGLLFLAAMSVGRIPANVATFFILFLGIAAFSRFMLPNDDEVGGGWPLTIITALALLGLYVIVWVSGLAIREFTLDVLGLAAFVIGALTIFAPVLVEPSENWEALKAIMTFNLGRNYPFKAVVGHKLVTRDTGVLPVSRFFAGPGIILTDADRALVLYKIGGFERVAPPGLTLTRTFEMDKELVDLRVQLRTTKVEAKTRDGIAITLLVFTPMQIATGGQPIQLGRPFPHDAEAIRRAVHSARFDQDKDKKQGWDQVVCHAVEQITRDIIAEHTADELRGLEPRQKIRAQIEEQVRDFIQRENLGLQLIGAGIGNFEPPKEVIGQRIENWKAHWERQIASYQAQADAQEKHLEEMARADGHRELLSEIVAGLANIVELEGQQQNEVLVINLLEALERLASEYPELANHVRKTTPSIEFQIPAALISQSTTGGSQ